ncbi:MAG: 23S rRNA (adenine(1618)-N(6))-methyltransferase RlmF [Acidobacteria bacterium]|nr:23S rRNA (adenine(1618)-N(6))-methyltransferase RlmF [Acidobacteriota bacterium]
MEKTGLHPRNRHRGGYDFPALAQACPALGPFLLHAKHGGISIDFSDGAAVRALNRAILVQVYGVQGWELPEGFLCPPIPGRVDYLHHAADLMAAGGQLLRGSAVRVLDIGTGASLVYALLGHREYGWSFVGTDTSRAALLSAQRILEANPDLASGISLRHQRRPDAIFEGVVQQGERFDLVMSNPPFFHSAAEAKASTSAKWRKLGRASAGRNFGGQGAELWCEGGEVAFIRRMISESAARPGLARWFTSLVSKSANLPAIHRALRQAEAKDLHTVEMAQGQKKSRFVAWRF